MIYHNVSINSIQLFTANEEYNILTLYILHTMAYLNRLLYSPFFQNKFVLYGSLLLVLLSILRHIANRKFNAVILMALIGLLMSYFSKNMTIVLGIPLIFINLFVL